MHEFRTGRAASKEEWSGGHRSGGSLRLIRVGEPGGGGVREKRATPSSLVVSTVGMMAPLLGMEFWRESEAQR